MIQQFAKSAHILNTGCAIIFRWIAFGSLKKNMPVRDIPIGTRALTGQHARSGARYESGLERDFFELMTQEPLFDTADWQPLHINYRGSSGKWLRYTPDALVTFKIDPLTKILRRPLLVEVKYRSEYRKKFHELRGRFRAAREHARDMNWQFKVFTDREIRTIAFANRHFLHGFKERVPDPAHIEIILEQLGRVPSMNAQALLAALADDRWKRAAILPTLWWMVAHSHVHVNMFAPLTMQSLLSLYPWQ